MRRYSLAVPLKSGPFKVPGGRVIIFKRPGAHFKMVRQATNFKIME